MFIKKIRLYTNMRRKSCTAVSGKDKQDILIEAKKNPSQKAQLKLPVFQASGRYKVQLDTAGTRQRAEEDQPSVPYFSSAVC